jgi:arginyl-tRNA synthetase
MAEANKLPLEYKGYPLMRKDNVIYYGNMSDPYIIQMQIMGSIPVDEEMSMATKVSVQLQNTDPNLRNRDRVVRSSEKNSLYAAMDLAYVWLNRALSTR